MGAKSSDGPVVFVCYSQADQEDEDWRELIELVLEHAVSGERTWDERQWKLFTDSKDTTPGENWMGRIDQAITHTKLAILLVGPQFLNSTFINEYELPELHKRGIKLQILFTDPVNPQAAKYPDILKLQGFNRMSRPLSKLGSKEVTRVIADFREHIIEEIRLLSVGAPGTQAVEPVISRRRFGKIPRRASYFTGRESDREELDAHAWPGARLVVTGVLGIGKTQTVVEYAQKHWNGYPAGVYWIGPDDNAAKFDHCTELARMAETFGLAGLTDDESRMGVKRWLEKQEDWLLVFDDVRNIDALEPYLPTSSSGRIVMTTRVRATSGFERVRIEGLPPTDGATLLLRCADVLTNAEHFEQSYPPPDQKKERANFDAAIEISERFGGCPWLLAEIGYQIDAANLAVTEYNERLKHIGLSLKRRPKYFDEYDEEFRTAAQDNVLISDLLRLSSQLGPYEFPEDIFTVGGIVADPHLPSDDPKRLVQAFRDATSRNLAKRDPTRYTVIIDALLREILREEGRQQPYFDRVRATLVEIIPKSPEERNSRPDLVEHIRFVVEEIIVRGIRVDPIQLSCFASFLSDHDRNEEAISLLEHGLRKEEASGMSQHPDLVPILKTLVGVCIKNGKFEAARDYCQRSLKARQRDEGISALELVADYEELASICDTMGDSEGAVKYHKGALKIKNKVDSSAQTLNLAADMHQLGVKYYHRGEYDQATRAFKDALDLRGRAALSKSPVRLATRTNNFALSCGMLALGEFKLNHEDDASKYYQVAIQHFLRAMRLLDVENATPRMRELLVKCERSLEWLKRKWDALSSSKRGT